MVKGGSPPLTKGAVYATPTSASGRRIDARVRGGRGSVRANTSPRARWSIGPMRVRTPSVVKLISRFLAASFNNVFPLDWVNAIISSAGDSDIGLLVTANVFGFRA